MEETIEKRTLTPSNDEVAVGENMVVLKKHRENTKSVLAYSNATPIHGYWGAGYVCAFCPEQFRQPLALKRHTLKHPKISETYKVKHVRTHIVKLDVTGLKCRICNARILELEDLMSHLKSKHKKPMHFDIKNHMVPYKFENNELKCIKCGELFNNFKNISQHMNNVHFRNYECDKCDRGFVNKCSLITHSSKHRVGEFPCDCCKKVFNTRLRRTEHKRIFHLQKNKTRRCGYCSEKFIGMTQKIKHEVTKHNVKRPEFKCMVCGKIFISQRTLQCHKESVHLLFRRHKCPEEGCLKAFYMNTELQSHMLTHGTDKPFSCTLCPKVYKSKKSLNAHQYFHNEKRKFKCQMCNRRFMIKENLNLHMKKHGIL